MRKHFFAAAVAMSVFALQANAQQTNTQQQPATQQQSTGWDKSQQKDWLKQKLRDSLGFSDAKATEVINIENQYSPQKVDIMRDQSLNQTDKATKIRNIEDQMNTQLRTILSEDEITKFHDFQRKSSYKMKGSNQQNQSQPAIDNSGQKTNTP